MIKTTDHMVAQPVNDYDPAWTQWNMQNPDMARSVGAEAAPEPAEAPPEPESGEPEPQEPPANDDWRASIDDEGARKHAETFASPADAAKSAFSLRQKMSNAINIPGKDATDEDRAAYREKLGVPKTAGEYDFVMPEGTELTESDQAGLDRMKEMYHKAGMTPDQVKILNGELFTQEAGRKEDSAKKAEADVAQAETDLRKEWGDDYTANKNHADRALKAFGGDDFIHMMETAEFNGVKFGNNPALLKVFAGIGRKIDESTLDLTMTPETKQDAETKMDELTTEAHAARDRGETKKAETLFRERSELSDKVYGNSELVR